MFYSFIRDGCPCQNGWVSGKIPKGRGSFPIQKFILQIFAIINASLVMYSGNWRFVKKVLFLLSKLEKRKPLSLSLLESGEPFFKFLFLLSKLGKGISGFSFSSRNWRKEYQISLSLLDWTFWPLVNDWSRLPVPGQPHRVPSVEPWLCHVSSQQPWISSSLSS